MPNKQVIRKLFFSIQKGVLESYGVKKSQLEAALQKHENITLINPTYFTYRNGFLFTVFAVIFFFKP